jgi:hypothetical protein
MTVYGQLFDADVGVVAASLEASLMRDRRGTGFVAPAAFAD